MKRYAVDLFRVAEWHNLAAAFGRAAAASGRTPAVERFRADFERNLTVLQQQIVNGSVTVGKMTSFLIRDPKLRVIHAPCFRERVLHHALMAHMGPLLDKALIEDTYACRQGKGSLAAVKRCQYHMRRSSWFVQIDIKHFFANIDHSILLKRLERKFKNKGVLCLLDRIIASFASKPGKGLPLGSLTSQHFANYYLSGLDRYLLEDLKVKGMVRYMDDLFWCCGDTFQANDSLQKAKKWIHERLKLEVKPSERVGSSKNGTSFCGYRILPGRLLLSRRGKQRYSLRRRYWEHQFAKGKIDARQLQAGYAAVWGITAHADARTWRCEQLKRHPLTPALEVL